MRTDLSDFDVTSEHTMQVYGIHVRRQLARAVVGSSGMWGWKGLMTSAPSMRTESTELREKDSVYSQHRRE